MPSPEMEHARLLIKPEINFIDGLQVAAQLRHLPIYLFEGECQNI